MSNPRKVRAIYHDERKCDRRDALMLARIGRMDRALFYPVRHGSDGGAARSVAHQIARQPGAGPGSLINSVRFSLKSLGYAVPILRVNVFIKWPWISYPKRCER